MSATAVAVANQRAELESQRRTVAMGPWAVVILFALVLAAGTALRLWKLGASPAWQWDEAVYWRVAVNVQHGTLSEHPLLGVAWQPFLYQPPFYALLLAGWFD